MKLLRKLRTRYILLAIVSVLLVWNIVLILREQHPFGSYAHLVGLVLCSIMGALSASLLCDRFLLKLYADQPDHEKVRGLR